MILVHMEFDSKEEVKYFIDNSISTPFPLPFQVLSNDES